MRAKEFLNQAYQLDRKIRYKRAEINSLREISTAGGAISYDGMPRSPYPSGSPMENIMIKILSMEEELKSRQKELAGLKEEILAVIYQVDSEEYRLVLQKRYLQYENWEEIWNSLCVSKSWVMRKHREALEAVERILLEGK